MGGQLCSGCLHDVLATMHATQPRCTRCALRLRVTGQRCADCALAPVPWSFIVAAFDYESPADLLMSRYKHERRYELAPVLAALLVRSLNTLAVSLPEKVVLVPIPAARASLRRRGFNPAAELARALAKQMRLSLQGRWLLRTREGPKQSTLSRTDRCQRAVGSYFCPKPLPACTIALVDDVMTTGSTLRAAARACQAAGAGTIIGLVAARTPIEEGGILAQYRLP